MENRPAKKARASSPSTDASDAGINRYTGHRLVPGVGAATIERRVLDSSLTPERFFDQYVAKRRPVILVPPGAAAAEGGAASGAASFPGWGVRPLTPAYLRSAAGAAVVMVEDREDGHARFGRGMTKKLTFAEFIDEMERSDGEGRLYLTTQDLTEDASGRLSLLASPCKELRELGDIPLVPPLLGNLVPMTVNMWWGRSAGGSSSGLHHDFHDNLYCLLRGEKRFTLFSPADALRMRTAGTVEKVHPNGRVCYRGAATFADGSDGAARRHMEAERARLVAEAALTAVEAAGDEEAAAAAEAELEEALDLAINWERGEEGRDNDDDDDDDDDDEEEEEEEEEEEDETAASDVDGGSRGREDKDGGGSLARPTPDNFSTFEAAAGWNDATAARWPELADCGSAVAVVRASEMLYLPCGWFHEVVSLNGGNGDGNGDGKCDSNCSGAGGGGGTDHLAINWWMQPPDGCSFAEPYSHGFWQWDMRQRNSHRGEAM